MPKLYVAIINKNVTYFRIDLFWDFDRQKQDFEGRQGRQGSTTIIQKTGFRPFKDWLKLVSLTARGFNFMFWLKGFENEKHE